MSSFLVWIVITATIELFGTIIVFSYFSYEVEEIHSPIELFEWLVIFPIEDVKESFNFFGTVIISALLILVCFCGAMILLVMNYTFVLPIWLIGKQLCFSPRKKGWKNKND